MKVLVHGNPETSAIWRPLLAALEDRRVTDVISLSPPGFGAPVPGDFDPTAEAYTDWLVSTLAELPGPIDLLGHDWGAGHVFGVLARDWDALDVRSWVCDIAGLLHADYVWHEMARTWRSEDSGEEAVAAMANLSETERTALFEGLGLPRDIARDLARADGDAMGRCILRLYRTGDEAHLRSLRERILAATLPPGLVIDATEDAYVPSAQTKAVAGELGAALVTLEGHGHWWMTSAPEPAADALAAFWGSL